MPIYEIGPEHFRVVVWALKKQHERKVHGSRKAAYAVEAKLRERLGCSPRGPIVEDKTSQGEATDVIWMGGAGSFVYFIQAGNGPIKIGWTKHTSVRLRYMQTGNAERLRLLCAMPGGRVLERTLHRAFRAQCVEGEWFKPCQELLALIEELKLSMWRDPKNPGEAVWSDTASV